MDLVIDPIIGASYDASKIGAFVMDLPSEFWSYNIGSVCRTIFSETLLTDHYHVARCLIWASLDTLEESSQAGLSAQAQSQNLHLCVGINTTYNTSMHLN